MERFNRFVTLSWYDEFIEFLFRFVAKTSEPLLAAGLVISAADFLTKGALMQNNAQLTMAWAWTQALAIESSSGVVFVYALQSLKAQDKVKGVAYVVLAVLLAVTGGAMLLIQLLANTNGTNESALPVQFIVAMAVLRVTVSIAYVFLCRAKHIRFSGLDNSPRIETEPVQRETISDETTHIILEKLAEFEQMKQAIQQLSVRVVPVDVQVDVPQIAAPVEDGTLKPEGETIGDTINIQAQLFNLLAKVPDITVRDAADIIGKPSSTVGYHLKKMRQPSQE